MNTHNKNSYITLVRSQWILIQTLVPFQVNGGFARDIFELLHFSYKNNSVVLGIRNTLMSNQNDNTFGGKFELGNLSPSSNTALIPSIGVGFMA